MKLKCRVRSHRFVLVSYKGDGQMIPRMPDFFYYVILDHILGLLVGNRWPIITPPRSDTFEY